MDNKELIYDIIKGDIKSVKEIPFLLSNESYIVNDKYVVRIKKDKDYFYTYKREKEILDKTAKLFLSDHIIYLDRDGNKISDFIPDSHLFKGSDSEIVCVAKMLKSLHSCKEKVHTRFRTTERYVYYKANSGIKEKFPYEEVLIKHIKNIYHRHERVICHNNVLAKHIIFTKKRGYLIDYEFAGKNIALFDLASFISENNITNKHKIELFLRTYGIDEQDYHDLQYMIMFLNLFWFYWANERYSKTKKEKYKELIKIKRDLMDKDMKSPLLTLNK